MNKLFQEESVFLRPIEKEDLHFIKQWQNDYDISRYTSVDTFIPRSLIEEEKWLENQYTINHKRIFVIVYNEQKVGYILYSGLDLKNRVCWVGVAIGNKEFQNKGIASTA